MRKTLMCLAVFAFGCSAGTGTQDQTQSSYETTPTVEGDGGAHQPTPSAGRGEAGSDAGVTTEKTGVVPSGWLYTQAGKMYLSNGSSGTPWVGRGVNADDV